MLDNAIRPLAPVVAPTPAPTPTPAPQAKVAAHPFAEVLRQNREAASRPATPTPTLTPPSSSPAPAAKATAARAAESANDDSQPTEATAKPKGATAARSRDAESANEADNAASTTSASTTPTDATGSRTKDGDGKEAAGTGADTGQAAAAMASAEVAAKAEASTGRGTAGGCSDDAAGGDAARAATGLPGGSGASLPLGSTASRSATDAAKAERQSGIGSARDTTGDKAVDASPGASFAAVLADGKSAHAAGADSDRHGDGLAPTAPMTGFVPAGATSAAATTNATTATLPTPVHSPDFAAAFGVQVSVLAKDGVQRAELHLNPAEMGPVSIHITLDGSQARVDFGADVAATRHLIEAGLPELASALRDAGFTLAGGGVAEHSTPQRGSSGDGSDPARGAAARSASMQSNGDDAGIARMTRRVSAGGVDLYA